MARQAGRAFGADLALLQGKLADAFHWAAETDRGFMPAPLVTFFAPPLGTAAILLQHGTQASLNEAEQILRQMENYLAATHVERFRVEALVLQVVLYDKRGLRAQARQMLEHAVTLAQPGGLQRVFLDQGAALQDLLAELSMNSPLAAFGASFARQQAWPETTLVRLPLSSGCPWRP